MQSHPQQNRQQSGGTKHVCESRSATQKHPLFTHSDAPRHGRSSDPGIPLIQSTPTLRSLSVPRFALRRSEAAASLGISDTLFDNWIRDGRMPKGRKIDGVVLWDTRKIAAAWDALAEEDAG